MKVVKILLAVAAILRVADFAFAQTWTQTIAPSKNWVSIASSADGNKLIAASASSTYYTSTNAGIAWISNSEPQAGSSIGSWNSVASSADGTIIVATSAASTIWVSTNSGDSWISNNVAGVSAWQSAALSGDGNKLVAVAGGASFLGLIYTSTNYGVTRTPTSAPSNYWTSVASSADGNPLVAVAAARPNIHLEGFWFQLDKCKRALHKLGFSCFLGGWKQIGGGKPNRSC